MMALHAHISYSQIKSIAFQGDAPKLKIRLAVHFPDKPVDETGWKKLREQGE